MFLDTADELLEAPGGGMLLMWEMASSISLVRTAITRALDGKVSFFSHFLQLISDYREEECGLFVGHLRSHVPKFQIPD